jgi:hypothetical protein
VGLIPPYDYIANRLPYYDGCWRKFQYDPLVIPASHNGTTHLTKGADVVSALFYSLTSRTSDATRLRNGPINGSDES